LRTQFIDAVRKLYLMKIKANPDILTIKDVENRSIILRLINNLKTTDYKN